MPHWIKLLHSFLLLSRSAGFVLKPTCSTRLGTQLWADAGPSFRSPKPQENLEPAKKESMFDGSTRQILGLKDAAFVTEKWKIRLQLTKPITWIPLSLVVMCGAAASGNYHWIWNPLDPTDRNVILGLQDALKGLAAVTLAGPFSEGFAQTINDWYDREIDAINEPYRPIPSGAITKEEVFEQLRFLFFGGLGTALALDYASGHEFPTVTMIALLGYFFSYIYSAPPLKLKQNGWAGDLAIGTCYISLPWWCGQAVFGQLDKPVDFILYVAKNDLYLMLPKVSNLYFINFSGLSSIL